MGAQHGETGVEDRRPVGHGGCAQGGASFFERDGAGGVRPVDGGREWDGLGLVGLAEGAGQGVGGGPLCHRERGGGGGAGGVDGVAPIARDQGMVAYNAEGRAEYGL